jgi:hypothetical protein
VSASIEIRAIGDRTYAVTLRHAGLTTRHEVSVPPALPAQLGLDSDEEERLVRASFEFLLERESPQSILRRFNLDVIQQYFPEYLTTIGSRVRTT